MQCSLVWKEGEARGGEETNDYESVERRRGGGRGMLRLLVK